MLSKMRSKRVGGFTLLELLVVVIIIGILAAVAMPQFRKMTRRARASEAENTVGTILTAEWAYYQEKDAFTIALGDLLVEVPPDADTNFDYAVTSAGPPVVVTGTGEAGTNVASIVVTGTLKNNGSRTIATTGL